MKLVGKKLYRVGPLKCFKGGGGGPRGPGAAVIARRKAAEEKQKRLEGELRTESFRDLYDEQQKGLYDRQVALAKRQGDPTSMMEKRLKQDVALAGSGRLKGRDLARMRESGQRTAIADQSAAAGREASALAGAGKGRFGMMRSDKMGRIGGIKKILGLDVARQASKDQAQATREANQCCVHPDTQIAMADGTTKKAKDVVIGDKLKTQAGEGTVEVISNPTLGHRSLYSYGRGSFFITGEHPIHANGEWKSLHIENSKINYGVDCKLLQVGDVLTLINGDSVRLEKIEGEANDFDLVLYDFHLDGNEDANHTYYANGLLVHNGGCAGGGEILSKYKRKNGKIEGRGTETSDEIPAMLSDGEFVINAKTVRGIGEAMGAEGKKQTREVGAKLLYDVQRKYGDKKPTKNMLGGMQIADLASHAAASGLMGKKLKGVGKVAAAGVAAKSAFDKKKLADSEKAAKDKETDDFRQSVKKKLELNKGGVIHKPVKVTPQDLLKKKAMGGEMKKDKYAKGGSVLREGEGSDKKPKDKKLSKLASKKRELDKLMNMLKNKKSVLREGEKGMKYGGEVEYAKGGKVEITPKAKQIPKELEKASKMHKSQAERLKKMGFKHGGHVKPDFLDVDKDGDKKEAMKKALKEKKMKYGGEVEYAKGGDVKLGKGVKAKKKFREAIGYKANKVFDKKAEKDYKKGDTGYKNYKGEKSVLPVKASLGGFLKKVGRVGIKAGMGFLTGGPAGAAVGAGKGVMDEVQGDKMKSQAKKQSMAQAKAEGAEKEKQAAESLKEEVKLKKGGVVKKDHPHKKYLEDLDKFLARQFPKGKKVEVDAKKKSFKAISDKKGSMQPMKFQKGKLVDLSESGKDKKLLQDLNNPKSKLNKMRKGRIDRVMKEGAKAESKADKSARQIEESNKKRERIKKMSSKGLGLNIYEKKKGVVPKRKLDIKESIGPSIFEKKKGVVPKSKPKAMSPNERENKQLSMPKPKKDKDDKKGLSNKEKADLGIALAKGVLSAKAGVLEGKRKRREALGKGLREAYGTDSLAGRQLMAAPVSLKKGGKVSFKEVLKRRKKLRY